VTLSSSFRDLLRKMSDALNEGLLFCSLQSSHCSSSSDSDEEGDVLVPKKPEKGCVFIFDKCKKYLETNNDKEEYILANDDLISSIVIKELINEILQSIFRNTT